MRRNTSTVVFVGLPRHENRGRPRKGQPQRCITCKTWFYRRPSIRGSKGRFCSRRCMAADAGWRRAVGLRNGPNRTAHSRRLEDEAAMPSTPGEEGRALLQQSASLFSQTLPTDVREEAIQALLVDVLAGSVLIERAAKMVPKYINESFRVLRPFQERSLDQPLGEDPDSATLHEFLAAPAVEPFQDEEEPVIVAAPRLGRRRGQWRLCQRCRCPLYIFPKAVGMKKYCSMACRRASGWHGSPLARPRVQRTCLYCQGDFTVTPGTLRRYPAKYCSRSCARHSKKGLQRKVLRQGGPCLYCHKPVPIKVNRTQGIKYCSDSCRNKYWHWKATQKRLCHWCGQPSSPDFKNACAHHAPYERMNGERNRAARHARLLAAGRCTACGKQRSLAPLKLCSFCREKALTGQKRRRQRVRETVLRDLRSRQLITVDEAAEKHLLVHRGGVHNLIDKGQLHVATKVLRKFWLHEPEVIAFAEGRFEKQRRLSGPGVGLLLGARPRNVSLHG